MRDTNTHEITLGRMIANLLDTLIYTIGIASVIETLFTYEESLLFRIPIATVMVLYGSRFVFKNAIEFIKMTS